MNDNIVEFDRDRHVEGHWGARGADEAPGYPYDDYVGVDHGGATWAALGELLEVIVIDATSSTCHGTRPRSVGGWSSRTASSRA
jgi:hypothetical protein